MSDWAQKKALLAEEKSEDVKKTIILMDGDTKLFSLYYVQYVLNFKKQIPVISPYFTLTSGTFVRLGAFYQG